jgi:hypothetical protein
VVARRSSGPSSQAPQPQVRIPQQTLDPVWSLKPWPVILTLHGRDYQVPAASAADWLSVLMVDSVDLDDVVRLMVEDGIALLLDETVGGELYDACLDIISQVAGRPWWQAIRLIGVAVKNWNTLGAEMLYRGVLPDQLSLSAWLDVLLMVTIKAMDPKDVMMFTLQLEKRPADVIDSVATEVPDMDRNAFLAMGR